MKRIIIVFLLLIAIPINIFAIKLENTKEGKIFGYQLRIVRSEITEEVCKACNYNNDTVIIKIRNQDRSFSQDLKNEGNETANKVWLIIGTWNAINGENKEGAEKGITKYLNDVSKRCEEKNCDTSWVNKYRKKISNIVEDYTLYLKCEEINDFSDYNNKYKNTGLFKDLVRKAQRGNSSKSEVESIGGTQREGSVDPESVRDPGEQGTIDSVIGDGNKYLLKKTIISFISIVIVVLLLIVVVFVYRKRINGAEKDDNEIKEPNDTKKTEMSTQPANLLDQKGETPKESQESPQNGTSDGGGTGLSIINKDKWVLVGASVKGNGHIQNNMPCQDNHKFESLSNGWGIAVVSDGAGSAAHSDLGSKVVVERGVFHFKNLIEKEGWMKSNTLPTDIEWLQKSYYTLKNIRNEVELVAHKNKVELKTLSATCLVVIYSPVGLLAVHVGDGRMGYKSGSGEWRAMMTPHKGEEANQTIFLVSDFWSIPNYVMSGVLVPESIVVREPVKAFALMSDGCENTSWKCTTLNTDTGKYYDQNKPFEGFFNPLEETLLSFYEEEVPEEERMAKWHRFIESGTSGFVKEQDDKTMIYGVNVNL